MAYARKVVSELDRCELEFHKQYVRELMFNNNNKADNHDSSKK